MLNFQIAMQIAMLMSGLCTLSACGLDLNREKPEDRLQEPFYPPQDFEGYWYFRTFEAPFGFKDQDDYFSAIEIDDRFVLKTIQIDHDTDGEKIVELGSYKLVSATEAHETKDSEDYKSILTLIDENHLRVTYQYKSNGVPKEFHTDYVRGDRTAALARRQIALAANQSTQIAKLEILPRLAGRSYTLVSQRSVFIRDDGSILYDMLKPAEKIPEIAVVDSNEIHFRILNVKSFFVDELGGVKINGDKIGKVIFRKLKSENPIQIQFMAKDLDHPTNLPGLDGLTSTVLSGEITFSETGVSFFENRKSETLKDTIQQTTIFKIDDN